MAVPMASPLCRIGNASSGLHNPGFNAILSQI